MFEEFLREKEYLDNLSPRTLKYYGWVFARWNDLIGEEPDAENIKTFVIKVRESGVSAFTANSYIRGMNAYLSWKGTGLKIKKVKEPQKILTLFDEKQLRAIVAHKGVSFSEKRLHALCCLLIDTGCRIDEALSLKKGDIDFSNLLIKVTGKGQKDRLVPISLECRAVLYKWCRHEFDYVFPAQGIKWSYRAALDQLKRLCRDVGIEGPRCSFHTFRHYFAVNYIRSGGDLYRLSKILGHTELQTTSVYLKHMGIEPIREAHRLYSPLSRLG
jgi:integrase/recombinase XerD